MKAQKTEDSQSNPEEKNNAESITITNFNVCMLIPCISVVSRSMEQNRGHWCKSMQPQTPAFQQRCPKSAAVASFPVIKIKMPRQKYLLGEIVGICVLVLVFVVVLFLAYSSKSRDPCDGEIKMAEIWSSRLQCIHNWEAESKEYMSVSPPLYSSGSQIVHQKLRWVFPQWLA